VSEKNNIKCPKDGNALVLMYEAEKLGNTARVMVYYKCPVCGYRKDAERLELQKTEQGILVKKFLYPP